jgi:CBS domain-containing protein
LSSKSRFDGDTRERLAFLRLGAEFARKYRRIRKDAEGYMYAGELCVRDVDTAEACESIAVVAERMHQRSVGAIVAVNHAKQVIGVITDRDLVVRVLAKGLNPNTTFMHEVMTVAPKTVSDNTPLETVLLVMRTGRFRRVPVVDSHNVLVGIVTLDEILMLMA